MKVIDTRIPDVKIIEPKVFQDERGFFYESFNQNEFNKAINSPVIFVQDNHSSSEKNTLRGLHYQVAPYAQGKLVRVTLGEVFDVAVDIRKNSSTFGHWVGEFLTADNRKQLWIPPGFAHGFLTLSDVAEFQYKCTNFYVPEAEGSIRWDDADIAIKWPLNRRPLLSEKDDLAPNLDNIKI
ncbi:dTDP-4-dehydrorhamnose 3,5-epimerase [Idiomarina sp. ST20R2A10]|uniref:dTDP-4-dehydrorhamnose 3,5-epimerase n=1 Tax=Idiomarina sp. ST20R2A10 TaxID=3418369 RepID=UPI003EC5FF1B